MGNPKELLKAFNYDQKALKLSKIKQKNESWGKALGIYKRTLKENKRDNSAWLGYARVLLHMGQTKEALRIYQTGYKYTDENNRHRFLNGMGNVYRQLASKNETSQKYNEKSEKLYRKAIKVIPKKGMVTPGLYLSNLSVVLAGLGKWNEAMASAKKSIYFLKKEELAGIKHGNQIKILELEADLYKEFKKRGGA